MQKKKLFKILKLNKSNRMNSKHKYASNKFNSDSLMIVKNSVFSKSKKFKTKIYFDHFNINLKKVKVPLRPLMYRKYYKYFDYGFLTEKIFVDKLLSRNKKRGNSLTAEKKLKSVLFSIYHCFKTYQKVARLLKHTKKKERKKISIKSLSLKKNFRYYHLSSYLMFSYAFYRRSVSKDLFRKKAEAQKYREFSDNLNYKTMSKILNNPIQKSNISYYGNEILNSFLNKKELWCLYEYLLEDLNKKARKKYKKYLKKNRK